MKKYMLLGVRKGISLVYIRSLLLLWLLSLLTAWATEATALWAVTTWAIAEAAWATALWAVAACFENLSLGFAECSWSSVSWKAEVVAEVLDTLVCECVVSMGPSVCLDAEALCNEGAADLIWVDVEAVELFVCAGLDIGNAQDTVFEEVAKNSPADSCWHVHFRERKSQNRRPWLYYF